MNYSYLIKPKKGVWVASRLFESELRQKLREADVCVSDLDGTDASSPARMLATENFLSRFFNDRNYRSWAYRSIRAKINQPGKRADSRLWQDYIERFLPPAVRREVAEKMFPPTKIRKILYPGVARFYSLLEARKYYLSRNIVEVVQQFGGRLGFDGCFGEQYNKWQSMENFIRSYPEFSRYVIRGDSDEDGEMKDVLDSAVRSRKIKYCLSLYRADRPLEEEHGFDAETGKDLNGLVELLWGKEQTEG